MHPPTRPGHRFITLFLSCVLAVGLLPASAIAQESAAGPEAAADWIAAELDSTEPSFDLFGRAAARTDVVPALASLDAREGSVRQALRELAADAAGYIGAPDELSVGALAKTLLAVLVANDDPADFLAGRDLEQELRATQRDDGSFADDTFTHALATIALGASEAGAPQDAVDWLAGRQNDDGSWPSDFDPAVADIDVTALALQALLAGSASDGVSEAAAFLAATQNEDGSFPNTFGQPNANTAGIAGQALRAAGETQAADLAAGFVLSLQTDDGGIRFTAEDAEANGFATLQGVLALGGPAYHELSADPFADVPWDHLFAVEVDWLGDSDISRGCDPPANDRYCPDGTVTRGEMAAFLHRALSNDLPSGEPTDFVDTDTSVFSADIEWLSSTGVTRGCNPPTNSDNGPPPGPRYCPDDTVTRGEMAAFLHRALGDDLPTGEPTDFVDTDTSVFSADIEWLSSTGVTRGCNPPTNSDNGPPPGPRYCPDDTVTRGEMAAFLHRALAG